MPLALVAAVGVTMFLHLDVPARIFFDETYYVNDARAYLQHAVEAGFAVHPPVGKWFIATGISLLGDNPVGWRIMGAAVAALTVWLVYLMGLRLFRRVGVAALAGLLLGLDGLFFVQARTGMLDIYLALFTVLGAYLLLLDRDRSGLELPPDSLGAPRTAPAEHAGEVTVTADPPVEDEPNQHEPIQQDVASRHDDETLQHDEAHQHDATDQHEETDQHDGQARPTRRLPHVRHPYRYLAGVSFGLAVATKWSGALGLVAAVLLTLLWELRWRRHVTGRATVAMPRLLASVALALVLVPVGTYVATYVPWIVNYPHSTEGKKVCGDTEAEQAACEVGIGDRFAGLWRYQREIAHFHLNLKATHPYRAPAYTWPVLGRPVVYYWETCSADRANGVPSTDSDGKVTTPEPCVVDQGQAAEIIALGNPALWWTFLAGSMLLLAGAVRGDQRASFVTTFYAVQFLPWLAVSRPAFFFYMVPVVPFIALGVAYAVQALTERRLSWRLVLATLVGAGVGYLAGYAGQQVANATTNTAPWLALGGGWVVGALVGGRWDARARRTAGRLEPPTPLAAGRWVGAGIAVAALALFLYFFPVWTGIPMSEQAVHQRWWLRSWV